MAVLVSNTSVLTENGVSLRTSISMMYVLCLTPSKHIIAVENSKYYYHRGLVPISCWGFTHKVDV